LDRSSREYDDPGRALHDAVGAIATIAERAAAQGAFAGLHRLLVLRGTTILSAIIRRGVVSGVFQPYAPDYVVEALPRAIAAGLCARWGFGLPEKGALRAGTAAAAALEILRPPAFPSPHDASA
jgi:hypothetical protein